MVSVKSAKIDSNQNQPAAIASSEIPFWGRLETLWLLIGPLCTALYALCQSLAPNDLWYHVRAGELINRLGAIPTQNSMSYGTPLDTPYYYQSWLAELVLFKTLQFGGLSGLQMLRAFCLTAAITLAVIATFRFILRTQDNIRTDSATRLNAARRTAIATLWGFAMLSNNVDLRPQTFSVLLCGAWIFTLLEFDAALETNSSSKKKLGLGVGLCLLTFIWANTHGAFILALLTLVGITIGKALTRHRETKTFVAITILCILIGLLNPRGIGLYHYVLLLSNDKISQKYIQEWGAPDFSEWHNVVFFLSLPLCALIAAFSFKKQRTALSQNIPYLIVLGIVFVMGMRDIRSIIWFAFFLIPVFALIFDRAFGSDTSSETATVPAPRGAAVMNLVLLLMLIALPIPLLPSVKATLPWPNEFKQRFAPTPQRLFPNDPALLLDRTTPVEAVEFWNTNPPKGRVFTDMVCGSYMSWATHPQILPLCEPRIELFPASFWEDYVQLANGKGDIAGKMKQWGASEALLDQTTQQPLIKKLKQLGWKQISGGGKTVLLKRIP